MTDPLVGLGDVIPDVIPESIKYTPIIVKFLKKFEKSSKTHFVDVSGMPGSP